MAVPGVTIDVNADASGAKRGLDSARNAVDDFKDKAAGAFGDLASKFGGIFAGLAGLAGIKELADEAGDIQDLADTFGTTAESIQKVKFAAEQSGSSIDAIAKSLVKANNNALDAVRGNGALAASFAALGIDAAEFVDMPLEEKMLESADAFANAGSNIEATAALMDVFGKSASELVVFFGQGSEALGELLKKAGVVANDDIKRLAEAGDKVEGAWNRVKGVIMSFLAWTIGKLETFLVYLGTAAAYVANLGDGFNEAAVQAGRFYETATKPDEESESSATKLDNLKEIEDEAKAEKDAEDELAKLKATNDAKQEAARLKALSLQERELELEKEIGRQKSRKLDHGSYLEPKEQEEIRGKLLDLNKELGENQAAQARDAEKEHNELHKRAQEELKAAEALAKAKAKAQADAKKDALKDAIDAKGDKISGLEKSQTALSVDSLRQVGGGFNVNYNAAFSKVDKEQQLIDLLKRQLEVQQSQLKELEKADKFTGGDNTFTE